MNTSLLILVTVVLVVGLGLIVRQLIRGYLETRGTRVIICPETRKPAAVEIDTLHAAATTVRGSTDLRLEDCSRWPEKAGCDQACLAQIELAPDGCRLQALLSDWYHQKSCVLCGHEFGEIHWHDHKPCLIDPEGRTFRWNDVQPETAPEMLETCRPVCWNCHIAEEFRRLYPDLVTDREMPPKGEDANSRVN